MQLSNYAMGNFVTIAIAQDSVFYLGWPIAFYNFVEAVLSRLELSLILHLRNRSKPLLTTIGNIYVLHSILIFETDVRKKRCYHDRETR